METLDFPFELKSINEQAGTFTGYAAVFGNVDLGGDVLEPGALTKTVSERPKVPILWQHDPKEPIGVGELQVDGHGLKVNGKLTMSVRRAQEARALMQDGALGGLSIGYQAVKKSYQGGVRLLKEIAVREFSPVTFPMNELATFAGVKSLIDGLRDGSASKADVEAAIEALQSLLAGEPDGQSTPVGGADNPEVEPELSTRLRLIHQQIREAA